jgi:HAD superfamily hydrolase (TIGR01549 family)
MKKYRGVLFDLFGTVALFDRDKLPLFAWNGQTTRSTMGRVRLIYERQMSNVPFAQFFAALSDVSGELANEKTRSLREFSSVYRFTQTLLRAGFSVSAETDSFAEQLALAHMSALSHATAVPEEHVDFLAQVRKIYAVALVSNFDHGPTAREVLHSGGVDDHFQRIVVSEEHGWRKPHPKIFSDTLSALGISADAALFVGDSPQDDIVGAKAVGMDVAWVNAQAAALPQGAPTPEYIVSAIPELKKILF